MLKQCVTNNFFIIIETKKSVYKERSKKNRSL